MYIPIYNTRIETLNNDLCAFNNLTICQIVPLPWTINYVYIIYTKYNSFS